MRPAAFALALCALLPAALAAQPAHHPPAARPAASSPASTARAPRVVTVVASDYAFAAPASIPAGPTTFRMVNKGKELHHVWVVRLDQGKTVQDYMRAMQATAKGEAPPPAWATDMGGPQQGAPGALADATLDLSAGNYAIVCHIPSPDGVTHAAKGMYRALTVTAAPAGRPAAAPKADVTMTLTDYDFTLSAPLTAGRRAVRIVNTAQQFHEAFIVRLAPGKTPQDALAWVDGGMKGPPPMTPVGGATGLANGRDMTFVADFTPGEYGLICFLPDAKDGKPHFAHGMVKQITVARR